MADWDVIVTGAGSAGIGAALAAARSGAKTLLIERYGYPGGTTTAGLVCHWDPIELMEMTGIIRELYQDLKSTGALLDFPGKRIEMPFTFWESGCGFDPEAYKLLILAKLADAGVDLLLHSQVTDVSASRGHIDELVVLNKSGSSRLSARSFIDATGDGDVAFFAGAAYRKGDEEGKMMSPSLCFNVAGVDSAKTGAYLHSHPDEFGNHPRLGKFIRDVDNSIIWQGFRGLIAEARNKGDLDIELPEQGIGMSRLPVSGMFHVNATRATGIDGTDPMSLNRGEQLERKHIQCLFAFMQKHIPGFDGSYIASVAAQLGIRETRRIKGDYCLTLSDLRRKQTFADAVMRGKWAHCDVHSGKDMQWKFELIEGPYQIPYRSLVVQEIENLLVAGRCIWTDREVNGTVRIQPVCMETGQAAGTAAALAARADTDNRGVSTGEIQSRLHDQGVAL